MVPSVGSFDERRAQEGLNLKKALTSTTSKSRTQLSSIRDLLVVDVKLYFARF